MRAVAVLAMMAGSLTACGAGGLGEAIAPAQHSANEALGEDETCRAVAEYAEPLIVDWKAHQRLDLELAMKDSVAVVAYTCDKFVLLKGCSVPGSYAFAGVSRKEDVVQLTNRDEVKANLPLSGATLGASLERGATIDLALVMIGKKATTVKTAAREQLDGACEGATHIVKAATVGAFAMDRGTLGSAKAAAEIFGAGISGGSDAKRREKNTDGQVSACKKSTSSADAPPDQCQAALRLELVPVTEAIAKAPADEGNAEPEPKVAQRNPCPEGLVLASGKCTKPKATESYLCEDNDFADCKRQCDAGDPGSCYNLGLLLITDRFNRDPLQAEIVFENACAEGHAEACTAAGAWACASRDTTKRPKAGCREPDKSKRFRARGCELGDASGCISMFFSRKELGIDAGDAAGFLERSCKLGSSSACGLFGIIHIVSAEGDDAGFLREMLVVERDVPKGVAVLERSCAGEGTRNCMMLAEFYEEGKHVKANAQKRVHFLQIACQRGTTEACADLGKIYLAGAKGVAANRERAVVYLRRSCHVEQGWGDSDSCMKLGWELRLMGKYDEALDSYMRACTRGGKGCRDAASMANKMVAGKLHAQCAGGDGLACEELVPRLLEEGCERNDADSCKFLGSRFPDRALKFWRRACARQASSGRACEEYERLGGTPPPPPPKKRPKAKRASQ